MISFYPGPSKVYSDIPRYVQDAYKSGVMSINHRSSEFVEISKTVIHLLKSKLRIPEDYTLFFTSSATECWEILAQSLISKKSYHLFNGAFGQKWYEYTKKLKPNAEGLTFSLHNPIMPSGLNIPEDTEMICITQNETSNGTQVRNKTIAEIKKHYSEPLLAVDATSSLGGVYLDFKQADIWYASVQKCLGLPAGMALMICSPKALQKAREIGENNHYNSLLFMMEKMKVHQTTYTPNVLGIYLMMRTLKTSPIIEAQDSLIKERYNKWVEKINQLQHFKCLITNDEVRSHTVLTVEGKTEQITSIKREAKDAGILLGNGYGNWKMTTFRIANFPAIQRKEINRLENFLSSYY
ncbi:aminotransferase class V-fold PLP-dependent enzyme [Xanthovirga aplysinae]|uniref:aminotransferase class V-fold PLP-dependent enzyme n=1 Tax=Xanthovirga aplysinae TaxID=2529853 RepID=UPI0012BBCB85|nr:aminotransferase class V-fold PLP-dependent enzyme [Xanthovirga aplysinae]MTI29785.1 alanine--glyoxylate aminotransferase family protein [Xanthovirga aplysinae]